MCRLLGYLGTAVQINRLLTQPEHSLVVQSYKPREMTSGTVNVDGFGMGWYHAEQLTEPFTYKSTFPIWNDVNLPELGRFVESGCVLANVRGATAGQPLDLSNCQPFKHRLILGIHNGAIQNFRQTLYRPLRDRLNDTAYQAIIGNTDSEHLFALVINELDNDSTLPLVKALHHSLKTLRELAEHSQTNVSANIILTDGQKLVACRYAFGIAVPSLYWLHNDPSFPQSTFIVSEPLFSGDWQPCPENHLLVAEGNLKPQTLPI